MAIHFEMLKGLNFIGEENDSHYTFLVWGSGSPTLYSSNNNYNTVEEIIDENNTTFLGYLLTSAATQQDVEVLNVTKKFTINNVAIVSDDSGLQIGKLNVNNLTVDTGSCSDFTITKNFDCKSITANLDEVKVNVPMTTVGITSKDIIRALSFDTTSDKRAKDNIVYTDFSGLEIIKNIPVYQYTYKYSYTPVIGIMAQDLIKYNNTIHVVDNEAATGIDGDFMSIKSDRLVYVLWKAIQELTEEVEQLKAKVK